MVASFTKAAAREIASRNQFVPREQIGTLHSFAYRCFDNPTIAESKIDEWNKFAPAFRMGKNAAPSVDEPFQDAAGDTEGDRLSMDVQQFRARMTPHPWPNRKAEIFYSEWCRWKRESGYMDFTDLIETALEEVDCAPNDPSIGFFDEVQDFTALELALVRKWGSRMSFVILAGDDDQCIYSFKGATHDAFLHPEIPDDQKIFLEQSYRLPVAVHEYSQRWVAGIRSREPKTFKPRESEGVVRKIRATTRHVLPLVDDIEDRLSDGQSCMVLASCSYMLDPIKHAMKGAGIPFWNPFRVKRGDWNPLRGCGKALAYLRPDVKTFGEHARDWTWSDIKKWIEHVDAKKYLLRGAKAHVNRMAGDESTASKKAGFEFAMKWFQPGVQWWSTRLDTLKTLWKPKQAERLEYPVAVCEKRGPAGLREEPKVVLGTIHSVKGGQADVVYVFPDLSLRGFDQMATPKGRDDIRRVFYVAITRAKEELVLCSSCSGRIVRWI